jgi:hypothetical protein
MRCLMPNSRDDGYDKGVSSEIGDLEKVGGITKDDGSTRSPLTADTDASS